MLLLSLCLSASDGVRPFWFLEGDAFRLPVTLVLLPDIIYPAQLEYRVNLFACALRFFRLPVGQRRSSAKEALLMLLARCVGSLFSLGMQVWT